VLPLAEKIEYIRFFSSSRMVYLYALFAAFAFGVGTVFDAYLCRSVAALNTFRGVAYLVWSESLFFTESLLIKFLCVREFGL